MQLSDFRDWIMKVNTALTLLIIIQYSLFKYSAAIYISSLTALGLPCYEEVQISPCEGTTWPDSEVIWKVRGVWLAPATSATCYFNSSHCLTANAGDTLTQKQIAKPYTNSTNKCGNWKRSETEKDHKIVIVVLSHYEFQWLFIQIEFIETKSTNY